MHRELRDRFGSTITRAQMEEYRRETGKFPGWFYTEPFGSQHKISRGLYRIPVDHDGNPEPVSEPRPAMLAAKPRTAPKVTRGRQVRSVLANPFEDDETEQPEAVDYVPAKRGRKSTSDNDRHQIVPVTFIHGWACTSGLRHPAIPDVNGEVYQKKTCPQCSTPMTRHYWTRKV